MDKILYSEFIDIYENDETIKIIGKIDTDFLKLGKMETLYYSLPLIERMVLEIYKLIPDADIEYHQQGIMRPILSLINNNKEIKVLPSYIIELIEKIYGEEGIRNKLFHISETGKTIHVNYKEINFLIMKLLLILKNKLNDYTESNFKKIEYVL